MAGGIDKPVKLGWILGAMAIGLVLGLLVDDNGRLLGLPLVPVGSFLGAAFLALLKMVVVPLVMASVVSGVASLGNARDLGRLYAETGRPVLARSALREAVQAFGDLGAVSEAQATRLELELLGVA